MVPDQKQVIDALADGVLYLYRQQDESAWNEVALIATLSKLLPGFAQEFAQQHSAVKRMTSPRNAEELAALEAALKKSKL